MKRTTPPATLTLIACCVAATGMSSAAGQQPDLPRIAKPNQQFGIYGWVHRASLEPSVENAQRIRLCGTFTVSVADSNRQ
jgi:hypothetical protein